MKGTRERKTRATQISLIICNFKNTFESIFETMENSKMENSYEMYFYCRLESQCIFF